MGEGVAPPAAVNDAPGTCDTQADLLRLMRDAAERHAKSRSMALSHFSMYPADWEHYGCPSHVPLSDGNRVPLYPTGRTPLGFRWTYRKRSNRAR